MDWLKFILASFAVYRAAELISIDDGPYEVFKNIRAFFGRRAAEGKFYLNMADLLNCPYCVGVWLAAVAALLFPLQYFVLYWLAISGLQAFLESFCNGRKV